MLATVLAAAAGFAILPYSAIGILSPLIIEDSGMTRAQLGWLLTVIAFTGAVMAPVLGRAADLVDGRLGIVALFAVGCLSFVALGVAPNYAVLLGACAVAGVAQGAAHPATNKLISDHISPGRRGVITGIKVSGNQFAILIGGVLLPAGALIVGWRATLYGVAGAGVLAMAYSSRAVPKDSVTRPVGRVDVASGRMPAAVWWLTAFSFIMGTGGSAAMAFFPLYAYEELGFPVTAAGSLVALGGLVSIVGRITLGRFSEQSGRYVDMLSAFAGIGIAATIVSWSALGLGGWTLWVGAVLYGASVGSWISVAMLAAMALSRTGQAGRVTGIVGFGFGLGFGAGPPIFGTLVDVTGGYHASFATVTGILVAALGLCLVWRRLAHIDDFEVSGRAGGEAAGQLG